MEPKPLEDISLFRQYRPKQRAAVRQRYFTTREVEAAYGIAEQTLANWRTQDKGPSYFKYGRLVRYRAEDLERFVADQTVLTIDMPERSTADQWRRNFFIHGKMGTL